MSELLLDREDALQEQFEQEFVFSGADYGAPIVAHEVRLGKDNEEDKPNKEDSGGNDNPDPILEPGPPREGERSELSFADFGISMSNSGGRPRPGEGGPLPPPQPKTPKTPPPPPTPHP
jgi:hypothetical protein